MRNANKMFMKSLETGDLKKSIPCFYSKDEQGDNQHGQRTATHIASVKAGSSHDGRPVCDTCASILRQSSDLKVEPIHYAEPARKLHPDVAINAYTRRATLAMKRHLESEREYNQYQDGKHTGGNGPLEKGIIAKSLGAKTFIDVLEKSPRRARSNPTNTPPEGMPEEMHHSWRAFAGVPQSVMAKWKNPEHEMHHAYLAKEWTRINTNLNRYGVKHAHQEHTPESVKARIAKRMATVNAAKQGMENQRLAFAEHMKKIEGVRSIHHVSLDTEKARTAYITEKAGQGHLNYEQGNHLIAALGDYQRAGKMGEREILRAANFKEHFHDAADAHQEKTGSYEGFKQQLVHLHPHMADLAHRAMQHSSDAAHQQTRQLVRHANDAIELFKDQKHE